MKCDHTHPTQNAHALSMLRPTEEVRMRFIQLFQQGYAVPEARDQYINEIELEYGDDEAVMLAFLRSFLFIFICFSIGDHFC